MTDESAATDGMPRIAAASALMDLAEALGNARGGDDPIDGAVAIHGDLAASSGYIREAVRLGELHEVVRVRAQVADALEGDST